MSKKGKQSGHVFGGATPRKKYKLLKSISQPTEQLSVEAGEESYDYTEVRRTSVPVEKSLSEKAVEFLRVNGPMLAWVTIITSAVLAYSSLDNDVNNLKEDVKEVKKVSARNGGAINGIEKNQVKTNVNIEFIKSDLVDVKRAVNGLRESAEKN